MRLHYIQHEKFEKPAYIETWARSKGFSLTSTHTFDPEAQFPDLSTFDLLVVLGGSMSTYEEDKYPFLVPEKAFIKQCAEAGKKILGICLGSQLLADVFGSKVYPNQYKEIGWLPIQCTEEGLNSPFLGQLMDPTWVFHWHGDTFDLPKGAKHLAYSEGCKNQAFSIGNQILGLQFHLEIEPASVELMVKFGSDELIDGHKYIQNSSTILLGNTNIPKNNTIMGNILEKFVQM
ncbi:MAG: type 1 glutamine amidotransferase [Cytophagales bacterium]|nr:type 1 glutamine amidotransferase [Cytophagales bacterium]